MIKIIAKKCIWPSFYAGLLLYFWILISSLTTSAAGYGAAMVGIFWQVGFFIVIPILWLLSYMFSIAIIFPMYAIIFHKKTSGHHWDFLIAPLIVCCWLLSIIYFDKNPRHQLASSLSACLIIFIYLLILSAGIRFPMKNNNHTDQ